jgi:hypothetical protein
MDSNFWIILVSVIVISGFVYSISLIYYARMLLRSSQDQSKALREQTEALRELTKAIVSLPSRAAAIEMEEEVKDRLTAEQARAQRRIRRD